MPRKAESPSIDSLTKLFDFSVDDMKWLMDEFHLDMKKGLSDKESSLKMLPAFVDRATGKELGRYIALDFGGTNFRVLQVKLDGKGKARLEHSSKFVIPNAVIRGTGTQLFNFIAQSIKKFMDRFSIRMAEGRDMGFTFSFPMKQDNIASGILINWTKGFTATGVVNANVVKLLRTALSRFGLESVRISALANDTVGTLAAKSYEDPDCDVGIIFGTGTNACYREDVRKIRKFGGSYAKKHMIINTEWGNFDKLRMIDYDERLDKSTNNQGKQRMEKMISGMYLGEIARLVLSDMIKKRLIFSGSKVKFSKGNFKTRHMSLVESDRSESLMKIEGYLEGIGIPDTTREDRELLKRICRIVSRRAARISAAAMSAVLTWMDPNLKRGHTVAIDGTLYEKYPRFRQSIIQALKELHGDSYKRIKLTQAKDGSGIGVAIVAAVASGLFKS